MNLKLSIVNYQLSILLLLFFSLPLKAQVTIGAQKAPHSYSVLELKSAKGLRLPVLSNSERDALNLTSDSTEASGLVIYNTDIDCVEFWSDGKWIDLCSATPASSIVNSITLTSAAGTDAQTVCSGTAITPITYATTGATGATVVGLPAGVSGSWDAGVVTISGTPATSGNFTYVVALTGGKGTGMDIGTITVDTVPKLTIIGNNVVVLKNTTATYSVIPVSGVTNYKWAVSGTDWSITGGQGSSSITVTSGTTDDTISVSATNRCGVDTARMVIRVGCAVKSFTGWTTFMCYNLGAPAAIQSLTPEQQANRTTTFFEYGDLYQWGRAADGHQLRSATPVDGGSGSRDIAYDSNSQIPKSDSWYGAPVYFNSEPYDWHGNSVSYQDDHLWDGTYPANNPCPDGWRVPTMMEWNNIYYIASNTWTWNSSGTPGYLIKPSGSTEATLFLPAIGHRSSSNGTIGGGTMGYYWSSSVKDTSAYFMYFTAGGAQPNNSTYRAEGLAVRCVKAD